MMMTQPSLPAAEPASALAKMDSTSPPLRGVDARIARNRDDVTLAAWKTFLAERGFQPAFV